MKYLEDVRAQAETFYRRNHRAWLKGEFTQRAIGLQPPTAQDVAADSGRAVGAWLNHWARYPRKVETVRKRIGYLGTYDVPARVVLDTPAAAAAAAGCAEEWARMVEVLDLIVDALGEDVRAPLAAQAQSWAQWSDRKVNQYIAVVHWLRKHDPVGYYLRELPIRGVDTKWIEDNSKVVNAVHQLQGFREKPRMVEIRALDPALPVGDFLHVQCPVTELSTMQVAAENIIIVENHQTFLALPQLERTWAMFGSGYRSDALAAGLRWLREKNVHYWGDLDSHGFDMVSRTRAVLPALRTVLMDLNTVIHHEEMAVEEPTVLSYEPENLTAGERQSLDYLREHTQGRSLRIEQERIDFQWVCSHLKSHVGHR